VNGTILLSDSGQRDASGKAHLLGACWAATGTPTPLMAITIVIDVPWDQTNRPHPIVVELIDADGRPVSFEDGPEGPLPAMRMEADLEAGRPPGTPPGTPLRQLFCLTIPPGMPLTAGQKYEFRLTIDGEPMDTWMSSFMVRSA
jgi:hypothetical protein